MKVKEHQLFASLVRPPANRLRHRPPSTVRGSILVFLSSLAIAGATVIEFDLSPAGDGLSPANEVPAVVGITGSGNEISAGISFDTTTSILTYAIGYGSAAGFTDLTGPATDMHIHGPAAVGTRHGPRFLVERSSGAL